MKHLGLESLVHAVLGVLCIGVEIEIPVIDSRYMNAIPVQLDHVEMIAAVLVALFVLDDDEERFGRYGIGSAHRDAKIINRQYD